MKFLIAARHRYGEKSTHVGAGPSWWEARNAVRWQIFKQTGYMPRLTLTVLINPDRPKCK